MTAGVHPEIGRIGVEFAALRPHGGAAVIMADPPWHFRVRNEATGSAKAPQAHYACQPLDWIATLPVDALAAPNCLLWLWATNPMLPQALEVMAAWGFTFKTAGTWVKRTRHGKVAFGGGYVLRSANEPFLIGTRGRVKIDVAPRGVVLSGDGPDDEVAGLTLTIEAVRREHSRKPDAAFEAIDRMMPETEGRRVELFAREARPGWRAWGNETAKFGGEA